MRYTTAILALAGSAIATPHFSRPKPAEYKEVQNVHVVYETVIHTVYATEGFEPAKPTKEATSPPAYQAPVVTTTYVEEPKPAPTSSKAEYAEYSAVAPPPAPAPAPSSTTKEEAPAPAPTATAPAASGYQGVVDTWRAKMGMKPLEHDSKLESNAMDTVVSSNGQMVHKLNPGSFGQVLAPGNADDFEHVFVGGWLCEIPSLPGLDGVCAQQSEGWAYAGQTGHAEILTSDQYSKIGCALHQGIWCCDVA